MYKVTEQGKEYVTTRAKTANGIIRAFEAIPGGGIYEDDIREYRSDELSTERKIDILIKEGMIEKI